MPCTLNSWDQDRQERMHNEEEFGLYGIRAEVATVAACQACKALDALGLMPRQTPFLQR